VPRSRALPPAMLLAALAAAPAHAALPSVTVQDAHVVEGDAGTSSLRFEVVAIGTPRRLALDYSLSDLTASAASGDYASAGGVVSLAPEPARLIEQWGERNFTIPTGIAQAPNGDLLAVDGPSSRLNRFSSAGVLLQATKVESPEGVAVNSASEVFVLSFHGRVRVFNSTGKLLRSFGDTTQVGSDIAVDAAGSVYVSEVVSNRIQKYSSAGSGLAKLDLDGNVLKWTVTYSGTTGPVTAGHFHGPAPAGANAGVVVPFSGSMASPIVGQATLTPTQLDQLKQGLWYVNLHTAAHPGGELRGQVK